MADEKHILIIDDDSRNIFALTAVLKAKGYSVVSASSAKDGLILLKKNKGIKLVLLDMMMPDMDGYETLEVIRSDEDISGTPVIAVTAQAMMGDREKCLEAGASDYVSKPINVDLLLDLLNRYNGR
jgi:two-component system cell cycle response regulator DivK